MGSKLFVAAASIPLDSHERFFLIFAHFLVAVREKEVGQDSHKGV